MRGIYCLYGFPSQSFLLFLQLKIGLFCYSFVFFFIAQPQIFTESSGAQAPPQRTGAPAHFSTSHLWQLSTQSSRSREIQMYSSWLDLKKPGLNCLKYLAFTPDYQYATCLVTTDQLMMVVFLQLTSK